jgi:two-component system catabolic regulation response regulator CreB
VLGLELGGDDYLVKPFSPRELTARVKAILRRTNGSASATDLAAKPPPRTDEKVSEPGAVAEFVVDDECCSIRYRGIPLELTRYEYRLLKLLAAKPGRVYTREQLMNAVWEDPGASLDRTVDAHVKMLRAKLRAAGPGADPIQTHRGLGYSLRVGNPGGAAGGG